MECRNCKSSQVRKYGKTQSGSQRYRCNECGKTFTLERPRFNDEVKATAVKMCLNNVGFRKAAIFVGASHQAVQNWVKEAHEKLKNETGGALDTVTQDTDIIEFDEIYTFVKKNKTEC